MLELSNGVTGLLFLLMDVLDSWRLPCGISQEKTVFYSKIKVAWKIFVAFQPGLVLQISHGFLCLVCFSILYLPLSHVTFLSVLSSHLSSFQISETMDACIKHGLRLFCANIRNGRTDVPQIALELLDSICKTHFPNQRSYTHWLKRQVTPNCLSFVPCR